MVKSKQNYPLCAVVFLYTGATVMAVAPMQDASEPPNWSQWRGPTRDAKVTDGPPWPNALGNLTKRWHVSLGPSYSGPIVWGDRVFVTETENKERELVRALDRKTGNELWRASWEGALSVPFFAKANGDWIRSTPACDGESLYVGGIRDVLVCLDTKSGKERWRFDFPQRMNSAPPSFGFVCSPIVIGDFVYVQAAGGFAKLKKATGELVWKVLDTDEGMNSAFSSPLLTTIGETTQILVQTRQELVGVQPGDGKILWRQQVPSFRGMNILTPTVFGDGVFTSTYKNRSFFYDIQKKGEVFTVSEKWRTNAQAYMSSPVAIGNHAYLHLGNGRLCCIDLRNGKEMWRSKSFGKYWSMAAHGNRILALDERGELILFDADPVEFRLLDRKQVSENECWAHIATSGQDVFVRDLKGLTLFDWQDTVANATQ